MIIRKGTLFLYISTLSLVLGSSAYIKTSYVVSLIINVVELIVLAYCFLDLFRRKRLGKYFWIVASMFLLIGLSTYLGTKQYNAYIVYTIQALSATVFIKYGIEKYPMKIFSILRNILITLIILNFITVLVWSNGIGRYTDYYLLGKRIAFTPFLVASIFFSVIHDNIVERKSISKFTKWIICICYMTAWFEDVATALVSISISLIILYILWKQKIQINLFVFYVFYAVLFVAITVFDIQYHIPILSYFLVDVLGRDLTFDNRTIIWDAAIEAFWRRPLWGYGLTGGGSLVVQFEYVTKTLTAHNQILNTLYEGGICAFSAFVAMCSYIGSVLRKYRADNLVKICTAFIIGFFFIMFTEVQSEKALIFLVFATAANIQTIANNRENYTE